MSLEAYYRNNEGSGGRWQVMTKQRGFFELYHRDNRAAGDMGASRAGRHSGYMGWCPRVTFTVVGLPRREGKPAIVMVSGCRKATGSCNRT